MKSMVSLILIVCFVLGFAAQNSVRAEDFDPCKEPKDDTACSLISIAKLSKDLTDYYTAAKTAVEVGTQLGEALGWIKKSDPNDALYKKIRDDLLAVEEGAIWEATVNFIAPFHGNAVSARDHLVENKTDAIKSGSYYLEWSEQGTSAFSDIYAEGPFHRPYNPKLPIVAWASNFFAYTMQDLDPRPGNLVYDWHLGIPAFMQMISWRMQYIAALFPNFRTTIGEGGKDIEIEKYHTALQFHYNRILNGIRCGRYRPNTGSNAINPINQNYWACGDIFSGMAIFAHYAYPKDRESENYPDPKEGVWGCTEQEFKFFGCTTPDNRSYIAKDKYIWVAPATLNKDGDVINDAEILAELRSLLMRRMPLFEMKAMIDTLALYSHHSQDLTEGSLLIQAYGAPRFCLEVSNDVNIPLRLEQCSAEIGQHWVYSRTLFKRGIPDDILSNTIVNPSSGKCLTISSQLYMNKEFKIVIWQSALPGNTVLLDNCNGSDSQKWTYNRLTHVILNKLGTVLDIKYNNLQAGTQVWSWPPNGGRAQAWKTD